MDAPKPGCFECKKWTLFLVVLGKIFQSALLLLFFMAFYTHFMLVMGFFLGMTQATLASIEIANGYTNNLDIVIQNVAQAELMAKMDKAKEITGINYKINEIEPFKAAQRADMIVDDKVNMMGMTPEALTAPEKEKNADTNKLKDAFNDSHDFVSDLDAKAKKVKITYYVILISSGLAIVFGLIGMIGIFKEHIWCTTALAAWFVVELIEIIVFSAMMFFNYFLVIVVMFNTFIVALFLVDLITIRRNTISMELGHVHPPKY